MPRTRPARRRRRFHPIRWAFQNMRNDLNHDQLEAMHRAIIAKGATLYGTSENNHRDASSPLPNGWHTIQGRRGGPAGGPAIHYWPEEWELAAWGNPLMHLSRLFRSATRYFVWATFRHIPTGRLLTFVVVHFVPHADGGKADPGGRVTEKPRGRLVRAALAVLVTFARGAGGNLVLVGDLNVDLRADLATHDPDAPVETFAGAGLKPVQAYTGQTVKATHGPRHAYDQCYVRSRRHKLRPRRVHLLPKGPSDHAGLLVEAGLEERP